MKYIEVSISGYLLFDKANKWCRKRFGRKNNQWWTYDDGHGNYIFVFKNESDATAFSLKWKL